ncbi:putative short chain dehydrogenase [Rosellinia necatrix]|uniref:Putative short chain dehydrogenase n=1 Tax=Rosellinia necatrix TaxID=77044 RepID=A0A1W2TU50_ROSNE|nr:putative short chain dehydrogenase [Rosellinia necatrix]
MPSYLITGVSKGLGFEFLRQLSSDERNTIIGLVRDSPATQKKVQEELGGRANIHILHGDLDNYESLQKAAEDAASITGGSLDYLIANASRISYWDSYDPIGVLLQQDRKRLEVELTKHYQTTVIGNINLYGLFMPLVLKGTVKKVVAISTGISDLSMINQLQLEASPLYAIAKAGMNVMTAKFSAQYKKDGVLFMSICPGTVDVGHNRDMTPEQMATMHVLMAKFKSYAPHFERQATAEESVRDVISVWDRASIERGDAGQFVSHLGTKQWL